MDRRQFIQAASAVTASLGFPLLSSAAQINSAASTLPREKGIPRIMALGVGGCGGHFVRTFMHGTPQGLELACIDADTPSSPNTGAPIQSLIWERNPFGETPPKNDLDRITRAFASDLRHRIAHLLSGIDMLIITAGLGGETGAAVVPIVAEIAKEMGILTLAIVTTPFEYENRMPTANDTLATLELMAVNTLVISHARLGAALSPETPMKEAFKLIDNVLFDVMSVLASPLTSPDFIYINLDDIRATLNNSHRVTFGSGRATGKQRAELAMQQAMQFAYMAQQDGAKANRFIVTIRGNDEMRMIDVRQAINTLRQRVSPEAIIMFNTIHDQQMGDALRVSVLGAFSQQVV